MGNKPGKGIKFSKLPTEGKKDDDITHSHEVENQIVKHPFIIVIGISKYDPPYKALKAPRVDVEHMKHLWLEKFKYDKNYVSIATEEIKSDYVSGKDDSNVFEFKS